MQAIARTHDTCTHANTRTRAPLRSSAAGRSDCQSCTWLDECAAHARDPISCQSITEMMSGRGWRPAPCRDTQRPMRRPPAAVTPFTACTAEGGAAACALTQKQLGNGADRALGESWVGWLATRKCFIAPPRQLVACVEGWGCRIGYHEGGRQGGRETGRKATAARRVENDGGKSTSGLVSVRRGPLVAWRLARSAAVVTRIERPREGLQSGGAAKPWRRRWPVRLSSASACGPPVSVSGQWLPWPGQALRQAPSGRP